MNMNKFTALLALMTVATIMTTGCFDIDRGVSQPTGETYNYICIDGVRYIKTGQGTSVMFNADGTVKTCVAK